MSLFSHIANLIHAKCLLQTHSAIGGKRLGDQVVNLVRGHAVQHQGGYLVIHLRPGLCQCRGKTTAETPCQYLGQRLFEQRKLVGLNVESLVTPAEIANDETQCIQLERLVMTVFRVSDTLATGSS